MASLPTRRRHVPAATRLPSLFALCLLVSRAHSQTLPYAQTTILLSNENTVPLQENISSDTAYIFSPLDGSVALLSINISGTIQASALNLHTLSSELPFLASSNTSFTSAIADNGTLVVYAGDCSSSNNASIWTLDPPQGPNNSEVEWRQRTISSSGNLAQFGPRFLGASVSFSTTLEPVMDPATIYAYGGMCHNSSIAANTSQAQASYSNQMIKLLPAESDSSTFSAQAMSNKGSPVAEAGFTLTGLSASIANRSGTATQQVNYVLLGGHTQQAFVNISTAAIWSLPEETWGFVNIETKGSGSSIDARSGHTAVLNEAGDTLIVLGGWVGNTQQAASPQLAVLSVGVGYGGKGDWEWSIPENQPTSSGIYGHGAALLPGNVMMVYGGFGISSSGSKLRRQTGGSSSPMFLNMTSMSWIDEYTNPSSTSTSSGSASGSGSSTDSDDAKRRLGLGLGLGLGLAAVLGAIIVYFGWRGYKLRRHAAREDMIRSLAQDTNRFLHEEPMAEREDGRVYWYTGGHDPYAEAGSSLGYESLRYGRGSMDGSRPMPSSVSAARMSNAPRAARGQYQAAPFGFYDPPPGSFGPRSSVIHPIYEADEESHHTVEEPPSPVKEANDREGARLSDPFLTPASTSTERPPSFPLAGRASATPSPDDRSHPDPEVQDWMSDVDAADALLTQRRTTHSTGVTGRGSPARRNTVKSFQSNFVGDEDGRTNSNISESNRSNLSRSGSARSYIQAKLGIGTAAALVAAESRQDSRSSNSEESQQSYHTAKSISVLQAEGPTLLMGRRAAAPADDGFDDLDMPGSPSKSKFRRSWLGSLRRVFSGPTPSPSPPESASSPVRDSMGESSDFDPRLGGLGTIAAGGLFKRKGGRGAWEAEDAYVYDGGASSPEGERGQQGRSDSRAAGAGEDEDDWDIEKAIERRLVQVMFTVPKERLRVVNAEPDIDSGESVVVVDPDDNDNDNENVNDNDNGDDDDKFSDRGSVRRYQLTDDGPTDENGARIGVALGGDEDLAYDPGTLLSGDEEEEEEDKDERGVKPDKGKQRETVDSSLGSEMDDIFGPLTHRETADSGLGSEMMLTMPSGGDDGRADVPLPSIESDAQAAAAGEEDSLLGYRETEGRYSRASEISEGQVRVAEAVKLQSPGLPRTRVLEMAELFESLSRSNSPERN